MSIEIRKEFLKILANSLNTGQINYLGERLTPGFSVQRESGFSPSIPLPAQTAAETLVRYYADEDDIVRLFGILLENENARFYNAPLRIWERDRFIKLLARNKWMYDPDLKYFCRDPFYEREINLLKKLRVIDLRAQPRLEKIVSDIAAAANKLSIRDLEWRITIRCYDMDRDAVELVRKIIDLLLARQDLLGYSYELFTCLKELAVNATKANYKLLFDRHVARPQGVGAGSDYREFMRLFKEEIEENANRRLVELARREDRYITIFFQSSPESVAIWVANNASISTIEKRRLLRKIRHGELSGDSFEAASDDFAEGAGMGIGLVLSILKRHSSEREPLKVVFYPDSIKIGFELRRDELSKEKERESAPATAGSDAGHVLGGQTLSTVAGDARRGATASGAWKKKSAPKTSGARGPSGKKKTATKRGPSPAKKKPTARAASSSKIKQKKKKKK